jgi:hypothetical protein
VVINKGLVDDRGPTSSRGTGFFLGDNCTIITAAHNLMGVPDAVLDGILTDRVEALRKAKVEFIVGSGDLRKVLIPSYERGGDDYDPMIWAVHSNDVVTLKLDPADCPSEFGYAIPAPKTIEYLRSKIDANGLALAQQVILAGFPDDRNLKGVTILRDVTLTDKLGGLFYTDGSSMARHGNSGGPAIVEIRVRGAVYKFCVGVMTDIVPDHDNPSRMIPLLTPLEAAARELGISED